MSELDLEKREKKLARKRTALQTLHNKYVKSRTFWCEICKLPCVASRQLEQHLISKRHKRKQELLDAGETMPRGRYHCDLCDQPYDENILYEEHLHTLRHRRNAAWAENNHETLSRSNPLADKDNSMETSAEDEQGTNATSATNEDLKESSLLTRKMQRQHPPLTKKIAASPPRSKEKIRTRPSRTKKIRTRHSLTMRKIRTWPPLRLSLLLL